MRFSTSAFAPACTSPNHCEADPLRLYPDASNGEAAVTRYRVFPGMELDYRDVHARACRELRDGSGERLEIHHCLEGRVEYRQNGRYFYLSPGDLAVARTSSLPPDSRFPTGHYHGITVTIDPAAAPECLSCILSDVEVRPAALMEKLCPGGTVFTARSSRRVKHVFSELYAVPEDIRKGYLKVKLLELLLFLSTLSPEDGQTPHGCTAAQVSLAEQVKARLLAESDRTLTLKAYPSSSTSPRRRSRAASPGSTACLRQPTPARSGCTARQRYYGKPTGRCWTSPVSLAMTMPANSPEPSGM